jgi:hypothetical protein
LESFQRPQLSNEHSKPRHISQHRKEKRIIGARVSLCRHFHISVQVKQPRFGKVLPEHQREKPLPTDLQESNLEELMNKNQVMFPIWRSATLDHDQNTLR